MGSYRHVTRDDRDQIAGMRAAGLTLTEIGGAVGKSKSTISRELRHDALDSGGYSAAIADGAFLTSGRLENENPDKRARMSGLSPTPDLGRIRKTPVILVVTDRRELDAGRDQETRCGNLHHFDPRAVTFSAVVLTALIIVSAM